METSIKKEPRPSKINRTKPSSSKKLARIIQRRQEKVAEWRLKKERETMATQLSHDSSITTQTSVESVNEREYKCSRACVIVDAKALQVCVLGIGNFAYF